MGRRVPVPLATAGLTTIRMGRNELASRYGNAAQSSHSQVRSRLHVPRRVQVSCGALGPQRTTTQNFDTAIARKTTAGYSRKPVAAGLASYNSLPG